MRMSSVRNLVAVAIAAGLALAPATAFAADSLYRVYDPSTGEHLYTTHMEEVEHLQGKGWHFEKDQTTTVPSKGTPVWRVYNPATNDHHYTADKHEAEVLTGERGWVYDFSGNPAFYGSNEAHGTPVYRIYDTTCYHFGQLFTADKHERNVWLSTGHWNDEGIAWYAGDDIPPFADDAAEWHVNTSGTVLARVEDGVLYVRPASGENGTAELGPHDVLGDIATHGKVWKSDGAAAKTQDMSSTYPGIKTIKSSGTIIMNADSSYLFHGLKDLEDISAVADWDASKITNLQETFSYCEKLADLKPISKWDVSKVTNLQGLFYQDAALKDATPVAKWAPAAGANVQDAFVGTAVKDADIPSWAATKKADATDGTDSSKDTAADSTSSASGDAGSAKDSTTPAEKTGA